MSARVPVSADILANILQWYEADDVDGQQAIFACLFLKRELLPIAKKALYRNAVLLPHWKSDERIDRLEDQRRKATYRNKELVHFLVISMRDDTPSNTSNILCSLVRDCSHLRELELSSLRVDLVTAVRQSAFLPHTLTTMYILEFSMDVWEPVLRPLLSLKNLFICSTRRDNDNSSEFFDYLRDQTRRAEWQISTSQDANCCWQALHIKEAKLEKKDGDEFLASFLQITSAASLTFVSLPICDSWPNSLDMLPALKTLRLE
ncbi:hypothetical protein T439DRAFT_383935, partial [Meredithblackwellia eburnea MCA 4105]